MGLSYRLLLVLVALNLVPWRQPVLILAWDCGISPLVLPLQNTTFLDDIALNRGIVISLGSQQVGLRMNWSNNNTRLRLFDDCLANNANASQFRACEGASGSVFDPHNSFTPEIPGVWMTQVIRKDPEPLGARLERGITTAQFDNETTVQLPVEIWSKPNMPLEQLPDGQKAANKSYLALGPDSSVFKTMLEAGKIPSSVQGLYAGSRSLDYPADGELVLGGWNSARVGGPFINYTLAAFPMAIPCPLRVKVAQITLNNEKGANHLISPGSNSISACIDPLQSQFTFPDDLYATWAALTQHPSAYNASSDGPEAWTPQTYPAANIGLLGNLTVQLEGGYATTVPHYELVSYERGTVYSNLGEYGITNSSRIMAKVGKGLTDYGEDFGILLGNVFLASTYVRIDYERGQFGLAPAVIDNTGPSNIHTVCSMNTSVPAISTSSGANSNSTGVSNNHGAIRLSTSDIITICVTVPGVFVTAFGTWLAWKARRRHRREDLEGKAELENAERAAQAQASRTLSDGALTLASLNATSSPIAKHPSTIVETIGLQEWPSPLQLPGPEAD